MRVTELAERTKLSRRIITSYEQGEAVPSGESVDALSRVLGFPQQFFFQEALEELPVGSASFRSLSSMTASVRDSVLAAGTIALALARWLDEAFTLPVPAIPDLRGYEPAAAAASLRQSWNLGERSLTNVVHLLEANGVRVFSLAEDCREVDGFSFWRGEVPFVFLNTLKSGERGRFDAVHELGHLVLHRHGQPQGREAELEADSFASAFLMPRNTVLASAPRWVSSDRLVTGKKQWGVSVAAFARRLHDVGVITDWEYHRLCVEIARRGWRTQEPEPMKRERSQILAKVSADLKSRGKTWHSVADALHLPVAEVNALVFEMILLGLNGGARSSERTRKPTLKLL